LPASKIIPGKRYSPGELKRLINRSTAKELELEGYCLQYDVLSNTFAVVKATEASKYMRGPGGGRTDGKVVMGTATDWGELPKIKKRTPLQQKDALMIRLLEQVKATGKLPSQDDPRWAEILGAAWKDGEVQITTEVIQQVAARFLERSERERLAREYNLIVRPSPSD
jgi:hypothetical protein